MKANDHKGAKRAARKTARSVKQAKRIQSFMNPSWVESQRKVGVGKKKKVVIDVTDDKNANWLHKPTTTQFRKKVDKMLTGLLDEAMHKFMVTGCVQPTVMFLDRDFNVQEMGLPVFRNEEEKTVVFRRISDRAKKLHSHMVVLVNDSVMSKKKKLVNAIVAIAMSEPVTRVGTMIYKTELGAMMFEEGVIETPEKLDLMEPWWKEAA